LFETRTPKPVLLAVDDDAEALAKIEWELSQRYARGYRVVCEASAEAGIEALERCKADGGDVALVLADQWMAETNGPEFLERARFIFPTAKRVLLIAWRAWGDPRSAEAILQSMTLGVIDSYLIKPWWDYPDENFHRTITQFLYEWARSHRSGVAEVSVIGERSSPRSHKVRDLLQRNGVFHAFYPVDTKMGQVLLGRSGQTSAQLPVVIMLDGRILVDPSKAEIARAFGVSTRPQRRSFDLVVVGGGPAGLAATVYGASEGLSTLTLEREAVGGQAGSSSLIRNYLGFPWGVSGSELAQQAYLQAWVFGATVSFMIEATGLRREGTQLVVELSDATEVRTEAVVVATGASYRRLGVPSLEALSGAGVFYGAAVTEAQAMEDQDVYVVGGANSAGQAAMHLSKYASRVTLLVRGRSLTASMSAYLIKEIEATPNIGVRLNTRVVDGGGEGRLEHLVLEDSALGSTETVPAAALFVLIGAEPHSGWLSEELLSDERGFVLTGQDLQHDGHLPPGWSLERVPMPLETSMPGVFAVGDVRHGSVKRVASAVGEGSVAIQMVHAYLAEAFRHNAT
jgi:thioredoxin reductase (NADPH)